MNESSPVARVSDETQEFLSSSHRFLIGGSWVDAETGATLEVFNPATEQKSRPFPPAAQPTSTRR